MLGHHLLLKRHIHYKIKILIINLSHWRTT